MLPLQIPYYGGQVSDTFKTCSLGTYPGTGPKKVKIREETIKYSYKYIKKGKTDLNIFLSLIFILFLI